MAYSESLADRVRHALARSPGIEERRMFGGLAFLRFGRLTVAVVRDSLLARLGPEGAAEAVNGPDAEPFMNGSRPMKGWVLIGPDGSENDVRLAGWIDRAIEFVGQLPEP
ncbi:TfoX/Sxy family protein [Tundrisphaera sp. TA3]|uniref:TfoX/Sxy family protein n=1 Tax=Tundrisphaera sp. TA3 TaxID=3435775 RepID=UPI003EBE1831